MLSRTNLVLQLKDDSVTGRVRLVRVVVEVDEHNLLWANSAQVFDAMAEAIEREWRAILGLRPGLKKKAAEVLRVVVQGVLVMSCEVRPVWDPGSMAVLVEDQAGTWPSQMCTFEVFVHLEPPST